MKTTKCKKVTAYECPYCNDIYTTLRHAERCRDQQPIHFEQFAVLRLKSQKNNAAPIFWIVASIDFAEIDPKKFGVHQPLYSLERFPTRDGDAGMVDIHNSDVSKYEVVPRRQLSEAILKHIDILKRVYAE